MSTTRNDILHVTPNAGDWAVKAQGEPDPLHTSPSRGEAIDAAEDLARAAGKGRVIVHGPDGAIERQYGVDDAPHRVGSMTMGEIARHPATVTGAALALAAVGLGILLARR